MIRNIQLRHAGKYTCAVQTKVDSVSIATDVVVRGKEVHALFFCSKKSQHRKVFKYDIDAVARFAKPFLRETKECHHRS